MKDRISELPVSRRLLWATTGLLCLSSLPHAWNMRPPITLSFYLLVALRLLFWPDPARIPGPLVRIPLVIAGLLLVVQQAGLTEGRQFGVALLVIMAGLKLLELKSRRDLLVAVFLGYFLLTTLFLFSQSLLITLYVLLLTFAYTMLLVLANRLDERPDLHPPLKDTLALALGGIPVMVLLFALFPRLDGPLWSLNLGGATGITGMSDNIHMGSIASLSQSEEVAFRVRFHGKPPAAEERYWRGMVLWHTDGRNWTRVPSHAVRLPPPPAAGALSYEVTMEPSDQPWLFPLDRLTAAEATLKVDRDFQLASEKPIRRRFTWRASCRPPPLQEALDVRGRHLGLQLPQRVSPRTRQLADSWRRNSRNDAEVVRQALRYFNEQPFIYTLEPPLLGEDPVDQFLFETRQGFCEHYATSFVLLMRLAGIPARVVIGYLGGELNPVGGHLRVRQSDAHAWAEVWLAGSGWTRVDPTGAVAPERIQRGISPILAGEGAPARFRVTLPPGLLARLARDFAWYRDNLQLLWHYWVVGYDRDRQQTLLQKLGLEKFDGYRLGVMAVLGALLLGTLLFFLFGGRGRHPADPAGETWRQFRGKLGRKGLAIPESTGPLDTATLAMQRFPAQARTIHEIVTDYIRLRYSRDEANRQELRALRIKIRRLRL